ncbi:hypothetical protein [Endozoicomonas sp. SCSIO W0465]|uniref:hypothetical protein n=1 Tax=Endozoicomonas sp. SCSIO W0465 TaxID=2918516 RepID=UPI0020752718|nr:hypothetical protein [Endozoicomonas sp. SCSIO W0465]USE38577.1 hypothetical protein MJO57_10630 [Endozoicomonas sp. SCSIO W0465]
MEGTSGAGSVSLQQQQLIQDLTDKGNKCKITFGVNGEVSIEVMKDVQPTPGLKLSGQPSDASVPRKIPLKQRKAEIAAEKDTVTVREFIFNKLKSAKNHIQTAFTKKFPKAAERNSSFKESISKTFSDFKKAIKHENWEIIPEDSLKNGSEQLILEAQVHNDSINQLESLEGQQTEKQTELDTLNRVYKNTRKVCEDPEGVIHSKKRITVPIPIEGADPVIIESSDPLVRRDQVNEVMSQVRESGFVDRIKQLDSEIKFAKSEQKQLKSSIKESGNKILELFKAEQHTLDQAKDRNTNLSKLQDKLSDERIKEDTEAEQLQDEILGLKNEKQQTKQYITEEKKSLSKLNKDLNSLSKLKINNPDIIKVCDSMKASIQEKEELIEHGNARLKAIPNEIKKKKAALDDKMKAIDSLQQGKKLKEQEKADKREINDEQNKLKQQLGKNLRKK